MPGHRSPRAPGDPEAAEGADFDHGGDGQLGSDLRDCLEGRVPVGGKRCALLGPEGPRPDLRHELLSTDIDTMPVDDRDAVLGTFAEFRPELVLHGGALTAVDRCEVEPDLAFAVNAVGTRHVAEAAARVGAHVVYVSTDYVFDGTSDRAYREWDSPQPEVRLRCLQAGGGARVPARVHDRAHELGVRCARCQHGRDSAAPGPRATASCASSTTNTGRRRSPPTWRPRS